MDAPASHSRDALIAQAIESVLDAEREAQKRIALCELQCQERIAGAREKRRALQERARARIVRLHTRVARAIEAEDARLKEHTPVATAETSGRLQDPVRWNAALARLLEALTGPDPSR